MSISLSRSLVAGLLGSVLASCAFAQNAPRLNVRPQVRVVDKVDAKKSTVLANSTPAILSNAVDNGRLPASTQFSHLMLVLKSTDEQESALHGLLDDQQDKSSENYHKWMTPDTFATSFGVASPDITKVSAWLQDSGFSIDKVSTGGRVISFSGTSGQIEKAFQTEMHKVTVNGETHVSNTKDISIPSALAPVVHGVASLNDFRPKRGAAGLRKAAVGTDNQLHPLIPGTNSPDYTSLSSGNHFVGAADLQTIYNATPITSNGIDGTGVTIGIIGQTSVSLADIQTYRSIFHLPVNDPQIVNVGPAPGVIADDFESDLDLELSGALAVNAKIQFYTAGYSGYDEGIDTSALTAVDTNQADILSLSYGGCESSNAASGTAYWNTLWEQAAAQGQTVFVSTGDASATGCANENTQVLATGSTGVYGVNALGSGPYNVAVGGSMFYEGTATGVTPYWGAGGTAPFGTALSYIPEAVWSEGSFDQEQAFTGLSGGGGGVSIFTARPSWQVGPGISPTADPAGPTFTTTGAIPATQLHRLVPDVSLIAASEHDPTIVCAEGSCHLNADGSIAALGLVGGTSVAAPTMAGVQALINQKNGGRQGNANYYYYKLAAAQNTANCASTLPPASTCNFNDIVTGDNYSPKTTKGFYNIPTGTIAGTLGTDYLGFPAGTGFDVASGLGTPNIANLANNWSTVTFNASKTTLSLSPTTTTHGTAIAATISVTANAGTPTGQVSIIAQGQTAGTGDGNFYTLSNGTATASITSLPGGTYSVTAHYAGDSVYGASDSTPVTVTIAKEPTEIFLTSYNITTAGAFNNATTFAYGTSIYLDTDVQGASTTGLTGNNVLNTGTPTGTMLFNVSTGGTSLPSYTTTIDAFGTTFLEVAQTFTNFDIVANYPAIAPGSYTLKATYSGDNSFNTVNSSTNVTVVKASSTPRVVVGTADIASGANASFNITVATSGGGVAPTGTVTLTDTTTSTLLGTATLANGAAVFNTTLITKAGANTVVAAYSGDNFYNATNSANATITVGGTSTSLTLGASTAAAQVLSKVVFTATIPTGVTGTVYFYDNSTVALGSGTISNTTHLATLSLVSLPAGVHNVTATYAGSATYSSATSTPVQVTITPNTPTLALTSQQANATSANVAMSATLVLSPALQQLTTSTVPANPAPSQPVQFLDGSTVLGTGTLAFTPNYLTYATSFTTQALTPGPHTLTASYIGDPNYANVTSNTQTVNIGLTTTTVSASSYNVGVNPVTLTAKIAPQVANTTPIGGSVKFYDGLTLLGSGTVTAGVATLPVTLPGVATHSITAVYSGDGNYYTSTSAAVTVNTDLTTTTLKVSSANVGITPVTFTATVAPVIADATTITGSVKFYDGTTLLGSGTVTGGVATLSIALRGVATHSITAAYSGDSSFYSSTSSAATVNTDLTTTTLSSSSVNTGTNMPVTLTATIASASTFLATITGTVSFYDGSTLLGTGTVNSSGGVYTATYAATFINVATHNISASYSGDSQFYSSSTTSALSIVSVTPSFTLSITPSTLSISRGGVGTLAITANVVGNYSGVANLSCANLPASTYCVFSQPAILMNGTDGAIGPVTLTVVTGAPVASNRQETASSIRVASLLWVPALFFAGFLGLRRKQLTLRGRQLMVFAMLLCGAMAMTGCNDTYTQPFGTPTGASSFVINASGTGTTGASGNVSASATVSLTVQ